jgi:hypothetical protein
MDVPLPFAPCAAVAAEPGIDLGIEPEGMEGLEAAENTNQDVDAIFAWLDDIVNLEEQPLPINEKTSMLMVYKPLLMQTTILKTYQ